MVAAVAPELTTAPARHEVWRTVLRKDGAKALMRMRWTPLAGGTSGSRGYLVTLQDVLGGRGGPWAVWADATELDRLRALKECPRLWNHQERLAQLRTPGPRGD